MFILFQPQFVDRNHNHLSTNNFHHREGPRRRTGIRKVYNRTFEFRRKRERRQRLLRVRQENATERKLDSVADVRFRTPFESRPLEQFLKGTSLAIDWRVSSLVSNQRFNGELCSPGFDSFRRGMQLVACSTCKKLQSRNAPLIGYGLAS